MIVLDADALATVTIYMEARGEPDEGKLAVAEVIRNRTAHHYSSNGTVASTVLWPEQFSCWDTHDPNRRVLGTLDYDDALVGACHAAWLLAKQGSTTVQGAVLYYAPASMAAPSWTSRARYLLSLGRHAFFSDPG